MTDRLAGRLRSAFGSFNEQLTLRLLPHGLLLLTIVLVFTAVAAMLRADSQRRLVEGPLYLVLAAIPAVTLILSRKGILSGVASSLFADAAVTAVALLRLLLGHASVSGTSVFICVKILSTALLFPWGGRLQLIDAALTTLLYWAVLIVHGDTIDARNWLHQIVAPVLASMLSVSGAAMWARLRKEHDEAEARLSLALEQTRRAEMEKASLLEIVRGLNGTVDLQEVVERLQQQTAAVLDCDSVATFINDHDGESFRLIGIHGPLSELRGEALARTFSAIDKAVRCLEQGKSIVAGDLARKHFLAPDVFEHFKVRHLIISPLRVADRFFGGLVAVRTQRDVAFDSHHVGLLEGIAGQLALALEVIELYRQAQEEAETAGTLARIARELIESSDSTVLLPKLCALTRSALGCDVTTVYARESENDQFLGVAASGFSDEEWATLRALPIPAALVDEEAQLAADSAAWQSSVPQYPESLIDVLATRFAVTQLLRVPLRRRGQLHGVLTGSYRGRREPFTARQVHVAKSIGQLAAIVWQNAHLIEQLEHANRLQSDFVATMSHELRTPLNIITGYTDLLLEDTFGAMSPEQRETLQRVERSSQELIELVNTTLQVSRLDTGAACVDLRSFSLAELIDEVTVETRELWQRDGLRLTWKVNPAVPPLLSDRAKLKVILKNLIGNAAKFTEAGEIHIRADRRGDGVSIDVHDSGVGIPPDALPIIFERFRQADSSATRRFGGVGLGLYIVRRLLDLLGGTIHVESKVGRGSIFSLWLPDAITAETALSPPTDERPPSSAVA